MSEQKSMIYSLARNVLIICGLALVFGFFVVDNKTAYIFGVLIGMTVTIAKIFMMEDSFRKAMNKPPQAATNYIRAHYFLRYLITFIALFIGVYTPSIHFIGLIIGLLSLKPAAYIQGRLEPPVPKDGSVPFVEWEDEDDEEKSDFW